MFFEKLKNYSEPSGTGTEQVYEDSYDHDALEQVIRARLEER